MNNRLARKKAVVKDELAAIQDLIKKHYPDSVFQVTEGAEPGPRTLWLNVYTDLAQLDDISELVRDREFDLLVHKEFLLGVTPQPLRYLAPHLKKTPMAARNGSRRKTAASKTAPKKYSSRIRSGASLRAAHERKSEYRTRSKRGKK